MLGTPAIKLTSWFTSGYNGLNKVFEGSFFGVFRERARYASTPSNSIGLDNAPGGTAKTQQIIVDGVINSGFDQSHLIRFYNPRLNTLVPTHSFIPTKSALGITNGTDFGEVFSNRNLVSTHETPFDSYYAPATNEDHVSLTDCSAEWLTNEIDGHH